MINAKMQRGKEAKIENKSPSWRTLGCMYLALFGAICLPIVLCVLSIALPIWIESGSFCNVDNEVYRQINAEAEEWIETFKAIEHPVIRFSVPSGKKYVAITSSSHEERNYFFVVLESSRIDTMGVYGFMYEPSLSLSLEKGYYQYEYLDSGIYCYRRNRYHAQQ